MAQISDFGIWAKIWSKIGDFGPKTAYGGGFRLFFNGAALWAAFMRARGVKGQKSSIFGQFSIYTVLDRVNLKIEPKIEDFWLYFGQKSTIFGSVFCGLRPQVSPTGSPRKVFGPASPGGFKTGSKNLRFFDHFFILIFYFF